MVEVDSYNETAKKKLIEIIDSRKSSGKKKGKIDSLYPYQEDAIKRWVENNYQGFYVMATGTGKTLTAIHSAIELMKKQDVLTVICAPYKHLVKQWAIEVENEIDNCKIILVSSENASWDKEIADALVQKKYEPGLKLIIISTIVSFKGDRFSKQLAKYSGKKLLIVDEAHRFTNRNDENKDYDYLLGLSATPFSGSSSTSGKELMAYFGGCVYNLPIEEALEKKCLVTVY